MVGSSWIGNWHGSDASVVVSIADLVVDYGPRRALDHVSLTIPQGQVFGLLGPNGAGKTTLFRVLATLLEASSGRVDLCGHRLGEATAQIRSKITYMPDMAPMPSDMRAGEYLRFFAEMYGLNGRVRDLRVNEVLEMVGLMDRSKEICIKLSLGMRQRLALAKAVLHRPKLLMLDEPASGLDPLARVDLRLALKRLADEGATVVLSSHVIAEIEDLCTSIGMMDRGRLLDAGPIRQVLSRMGGPGQRVVIETEGEVGVLLDWLRMHLPGISVKGLQGQQVEIRVDPREIAREELFFRLGQARVGVIGLRVEDTKVEDILIQLGNNQRLT